MFNTRRSLPTKDEDDGHSLQQTRHHRSRPSSSTTNNKHISNNNIRANNNTGTTEHHYSEQQQQQWHQYNNENDDHSLSVSSVTRDDDGTVYSMNEADMTSMMNAESNQNHPNNDHHGNSHRANYRASPVCSRQAPFDATKTIYEMHCALLYLMSNPEEFAHVLHKAGCLRDHCGNNEPNSNDDDSMTVNSNNTSSSNSVFLSKVLKSDTPLPYVVFAPDAEVVLPQAHTASQLFGIEQIDGIELEAAAGIVPLSQLFLRWLALMPGGDHFNVWEPPGVNVMRIAGGRYRVTAAHRAVWTWYNHFSHPETISKMKHNNTKPQHNTTDFSTHNHFHDKNDSNNIEFGDLVTMTIVDVFETDAKGKLISYCPTFDNRSVQKTSQSAENLKKKSNEIKARVNAYRKTETGKILEQTTTKAAVALWNYAGKAAETVKGTILTPTTSTMKGGSNNDTSPTAKEASKPSTNHQQDKSIQTKPKQKEPSTTTNHQEEEDNSSEEGKFVMQQSSLLPIFDGGGEGDVIKGRSDYYFSDDDTFATNE